MAKLAQAPFIKVEASKFTEVGYVGRDVESIIRDLMETAMGLVLEEEKRAVRTKAEEVAEAPVEAPEVSEVHSQKMMMLGQAIHSF